MRAQFQNNSIGKKLGIIEAAIVLLLMSIFAFFIVHFTTGILKRNMEQDLKRQALSARNIVEVYGGDVKVSTDRLANVFVAYFAERFSIEPGKKVRIGEVDTPLLKCGDKVLNLNFEEVDRFSKMTGGVATVFARSGDDFVRITTSLKKENGSRAVGTLLGQQHPGYAAL